MLQGLRRFARVGIFTLVLILTMIGASSAYEAEINKLSAAMAEKVSAAGKQKVAVVDFTDLQGDVTELGRFIAEEFSVALAEAGKGFRVVDRTHLKSIIREHKLSATGVINPDTARKLGQIAGVEALVTGTLTPFGDSVRISAKILDTSTAEVIDAKRGNIAKTQAIEELLGRMAFGGMPSTPPSNPSIPNHDAQVKPYQRKVEKGFTFDLLKCKNAGKSVACHFLITSNGKDNTLYMYASYSTQKSRFFDNLGNEYRSSGVQLGDKKSSQKVKKALPANIPVKASLNFDNFSPDASYIAILELGAYGNDYFTVQFRDVAFPK